MAGQWSASTLTPVYGILDDKLTVLDCTFTVGGKQYPSAQTYPEDNLADIAAASLVPLASLREYEKLSAAGAATAQKPKTIHEPDIVDIDIPQCKGKAENTFAVIIGNERYQRVAPVEFAGNDADVFARYCEKTLGLPERNIRVYHDATLGDIVAAMQDIKDICDSYKGEARVIFYYAGHGVPDDATREAYLLPVDAAGAQKDVCYSLSRLYDELSALPSAETVAFIDACFTGSLRGEGMLASTRGIKLKPKDAQVQGNLVVFSAASADQSALPFDEKGHGMFTYFLLSKLRESKGGATLGEIADYVIDGVRRQSAVMDRHLQTPSVKYPTTMTDSWQKLQLGGK